MVADIEALRRRTEFFDDPGRLMAEHDRHGIAQRPGDDFEIGVAEPGRLDPHQHVAAAKPACDHRLDRHRRPDAMQHRRAVFDRHWPSLYSPTSGVRWSGVPRRTGGASSLIWKAPSTLATLPRRRAWRRNNRPRPHR